MLHRITKRSEDQEAELLRALVELGNQLQSGLELQVVVATIAGAFGNYLDVRHSLDIGLLPPVGERRISFVGNAAGVGAQMALIDTRVRERMARLRTRIGFLDLATSEEFPAAFSARLGL